MNVVFPDAISPLKPYILPGKKLDANNLDEFGQWHRELSPKLHKRTRLLSRYV